jgi:hypothetical protein
VLTRLNQRSVHMTPVQLTYKTGVRRTVKGCHWNRLMVGKFRKNSAAGQMCSCCKPITVSTQSCVTSCIVGPDL